MGVYFDRTCTVKILARELQEITEHRVKFEVTKSINHEHNNAKIEIYNLSQDTRDNITLGDSEIELYAGHSKNQGNIEIGHGDICSISYARDKTDHITRILAKNGLKAVRGTPLSFSYEQDVYVENVLKRIAKDAGLTLKAQGIKNTVIKYGYAFAGSPDQILNELATSYDFSWSIQHKSLWVYGSNQKITREVIHLTPETGLILNPQSVKKLSQKLQKLKDKGLLVEDIGLYQVQALLQPQLQPNDIISVVSADLKDHFYRIIKISHHGDTRGNEWYSDIQMRVV